MSEAHAAPDFSPKIVVLGFDVPKKPAMSADLMITDAGRNIFLHVKGDTPLPKGTRVIAQHDPKDRTHSNVTLLKIAAGPGETVSQKDLIELLGVTGIKAPEPYAVVDETINAPLPEWLQGKVEGAKWFRRVTYNGGSLFLVSKIQIKKGTVCKLKTDECHGWILEVEPQKDAVAERVSAHHSTFEVFCNDVKAKLYKAGIRPRREVVGILFGCSIDQRHTDGLENPVGNTFAFVKRAEGADETTGNIWVNRKGDHDDEPIAEGTPVRAYKLSQGCYAVEPFDGDTSDILVIDELPKMLGDKLNPMRTADDKPADGIRVKKSMPDQLKKGKGQKAKAGRS